MISFLLPYVLKLQAIFSFSEVQMPAGEWVEFEFEPAGERAEA